MKITAMIIGVAAACAIGLYAPVLSGDRVITNANWHSHPAILAVRSVCNEIEAGIAGRTVTKCRDHVEKNDAGLDVVYVLYCDAGGRVRKLTAHDGSEDSSVHTSHYYDANGKLRFVFVKAGAVNGASLEHRIYYDRGQNRIWEMQKYLGRARYTFPERWPDDRIVHDPAVRFSEQ